MRSTECTARPPIDLLIMAFTDAVTADETLRILEDARKKEQFYFEDAAAVTQDALGCLHYHETADTHTGDRAGAGGNSMGPGAGSIAANGAAGPQDNSLETVGAALMPNTSALVIVMSHEFQRVEKKAGVTELDAFVAELASVISRRLAEGCDLGLEIIVAEGGPTCTEVSMRVDSIEMVTFTEEELGIDEVSHGLTRLAASEAMAARSEELAAAGAILGAQGAAEVETALEEAALAREIGAAGVTDIAEGAAHYGAAESAGASE